MLHTWQDLAEHAMEPARERLSYEINSSWLDMNPVTYIEN